MTRYKNKYRIESARLQTWDYASEGAYFITICTKNRVHYFGEIVETQCIASLQMQLNELGQIAETEWIKTIELRPDMNLELGVFVVMPNHFHAIIMIGKNEYNTQNDVQSGAPRRDAMHRGDAMHCASTTNPTDPTDPTDLTTNGRKNKFGPQYKNLSSIIRGFKSSVTTNARKIGNTEFAWQSRFHDHIIRDAKSFERIQNYILNNPKNWSEDMFNSKKT